MSYTYAICRILGGELPPRDVPGERIKALKWILDNEPIFKDTSRFWLLNGLWDSSLEQEYRSLLDSYNQTYAIRPFSASYRADLPFEEKVRLAIDINGARNECIERMIPDFRFVAVLDGDCFFTQERWDELVQSIQENQTSDNPVKYFSIPTQRLAPGDPTRTATGKLTEAMLVFRNDAPLRFDENRRFGNSPKQALLWQLGHCNIRDKSHILVCPGQCVSTSRVFHYAHGDIAELDHDKRGELRLVSLQLLIEKLDRGFYA